MRDLKWRKLRQRPWVVSLPTLSILLGVPADAGETTPIDEVGKGADIFTKFAHGLADVLGIPNGAAALILAFASAALLGSWVVIWNLSRTSAQRTARELLDARNRELAAEKAASEMRDRLDREREEHHQEEVLALKGQIAELKSERADILRQLGVEREEHRVIVGSVARRHAAFRALARRADASA